MLSHVFSILQITHSAVIVYLTFILYEINKTVPMYLIAI